MHQPPAKNPPPDQETPAEQVEDALDEALKESFPASDPVAIEIEHPAKALEGP
jgi:hypothetical protein